MGWAVGSNSGKIPASHRGMVTIESTSVCNLACPLCPTGTGTLKRENKFIDIDQARKIIDMTEAYAKGYVISVFGEPTFHPRFSEILEMTRRLPTWLSTNLCYDEASIDELVRWDHLHVICSVDTLNGEEYPEYRVHGDYEKVLSNLKRLAKGKCNVYPQFLVAPDDYEEEKYRDFAEEYGIPFENMVIKTKLEEFRLDLTDKPVPGICHFLYTGVYFNCDGYLVPCCNNVRKDLHIGHIDTFVSLEEMLNGMRTRKVRQQLAEDKNVFPSCGRCRGHDYWKADFKEHVDCVASLFRRRKDGAKHIL
jgi:MoaA/NifB/PqqE/SkfB family radical SAM enzyme